MIPSMVWRRSLATGQDSLGWFNERWLEDSQRFPSISKEIDVIAADLTQTWSRMAVVDFSKPFLATSLTLLLKVTATVMIII